MNNNNEYTKTNVARRLFPKLPTHSATNKLSGWIKRNPRITAYLKSTGYNKNDRSFTVKQARVIFEELGAP